MQELFVYPEVATEILEKNSVNTESMSHRELGEALSLLSDKEHIKYTVSDIKFPKGYFYDNVISSIEEFPEKQPFQLEKDSDGRAITYINPETANEVILAGLHSLTNEQKAMILDLFPQSKYRSYRVGPIELDEEEACDRGNYILSAEDFFLSNHRNPEETNYFIRSTRTEIN